MIEGTTKRIEKTSYLTSLLYTVINRSRGKDGTQAPDARTLLQTVYLCINRLSPDYIGVELGIGESLLIKAISESTGRSIPSIKADLKKEGDLGLVAMVHSTKFALSLSLSNWTCTELQSESTNNLQAQNIDRAQCLCTTGRNCARRWRTISGKEDQNHYWATSCVPDNNREHHLVRGEVHHSLSRRQATHRPR